VLVFTSTKDQADLLLARLKECKVAAAVCHGDRSQGSRRRALAEFKDGKLQVLIATEVAARGLDIQGLDTVINFNLPYLAEDYVHRIGRTGRAGNEGLAISFVSSEEERSLAAIEKLIGATIKRLKKSGFEGRSNDKIMLETMEESSSTQTKTSQTKRIRDKVNKIKTATGKSALAIKTQKAKPSSAKLAEKPAAKKKQAKPSSKTAKTKKSF
jgi:superfamily II DNA/RNA helicase